MTDNEIRLRCLELALEHGLSTDKVAVAHEFERFVFMRPPPLDGAVYPFSDRGNSHAG